MASVVLQIGQCGNQIGEEFWKIVGNKNPTSVRGNVYENGDGYLRSVHVDSEPKVVQRLLSGLSGNIRGKNVVLGKRGRGTNWALGYHGIRGHEEHLVSETIDAVRKEAERCDAFSGIITMHSLCGGTGSGLGSKLCEVIRDEFGLHYLMSCVVAPHASGESPLQNYNSLLCLNSLIRNSDSVVLFSNDEVIYRLQRAARGRDAESAISFPQMNQHIGACLSGIFLPVDTLTPTSGVGTGLEPWEMLRTVTPMPHLKFTNVNHLTRTKLSWKNLAGNLVQTVKRYNDDGKPYLSLGNLVVARGDTTGDFPNHTNLVEEKIKNAYKCVDWNPFPVDFWSGKYNHVGSRDSASLTVAANSSSVLDLLERVVTGAEEKRQAGAYLHWYWKHGCEPGDFDVAFETVQQTICDYKDAVK